jgi:type IV pilus assembly protein PilC
MNVQYKVRDPLGKVHEGNLEAASLDDATQILRRDGFQVLALEEEDGQDGASLLPRFVRRNEIIYATSQLAIMVDTGITLSAALEGIASQEENPTLKRVLHDMKTRVESGEDFSAALGQHPKYFDKTFVALVRASEHTGTLGEMLDRVAGYLRKEVETKSKVRAALAYPAVMLFLAIGVTIFLLTYVLPKFEPLFNRKGITLPTPTVVMMSVSNALIGYWYLWLLAIVALVVGYFVAKRTETGRMAIDWVKINMPILGPVFRKVTISRSVHTLGTVLQAGVSVLDAIRLAGEVAGNYYYERTWKHVEEEVTQGSRICDALRGNTLFPATIVQMIGAGEEAAKLEYVLGKVSSYYDQEVETSIKTMTSLIEPIMITVMGAVVGGIALALLLPIFSLSRCGRSRRSNPAPHPTKSTISWPPASPSALYACPSSSLPRSCTCLRRAAPKRAREVWPIFPAWRPSATGPGGGDRRATALPRPRASLP